MEEVTEVNEQVDSQVHDESKQETVSKEDHDQLLAELEELKGKLPKEKSEAELNIETKEKELFQKEVSLTLKENGLDQFATIVKVNDSDELNTTIEALTQIVNDIKVSTGYVPTEHGKDDAYTVALKKKDVGGMLTNKLQNLFK
ncbi:hypothetical protein CD798_08000 [Bacillaceae bacterium SAOS 7]|nr:hypothetical protein CD798_08000 [Bacillaceae bacterium SAOS 7]